VTAYTDAIRLLLMIFVNSITAYVQTFFSAGVLWDLLFHLIILASLWFLGSNSLQAELFAHTLEINLYVLCL
jgi:hypothetical protein